MTSSTKAIITFALILSCANLGVESFAPCLGRQPFHRQSKATFEPGQAFASQPQRTYSHHDVDTSRRYSETVDRPMPSNFEERMRNIALGKPPAVITGRRSRRNPMRPANVQEVMTLDEYKKAVADVKDKLVVVRFYARWCKACRAVAPSFYRMAKEYEDDAVFVELPVTENNANVHQGLGVPSIPFGHIYHPDGGLVEELRMVRKEFPRFEKVFKTYLSGSCDLPDGDCSNPYEAPSQEAQTMP